MVSVTVTDFGVVTSAAVPWPTGAVCSRPICVHTAVKRRNEMQQERRSIAGTTLTVASSDRRRLLPPLSGSAVPPMVSLPHGGLLGRRFLGEARGHLHLVLVRDDEVQDAH